MVTQFTNADVAIISRINYDKLQNIETRAGKLNILIIIDFLQLKFTLQFIRHFNHEFPHVTAF